MFCPRCYRTYDDPTHRYCPSDGASLLAASPLERLRSRPTKRRGAVLDGRYVIQGFVGKGGMARVYLAEDVRSEEPVAIKILLRERVQDELACERFLREVEVAATIEHPNVIRVLDAGKAHGVPYLVLEFLFGEALGDLLRRDAAVEPSFVLPLVEKAAAGLAAAHRAGIVHRDVKPDNLFLVGERGDPYDLKVVDFGMAKLLEGESTAAGLAVGTLEYMAPEQAIADVVDERADVYGLGVVLFRALTGRIPFEARDSGALIGQHLFAEPPRPRDLRPELDPSVEAVILKAMRKNPLCRYATMEELQDDLARLMGGRPGPLTASRRLLREDVYEPKTPFAQRVVRALARSGPR